MATALLAALVLTIVMTPVLYVAVNFIAGPRGAATLLRCVAGAAGLAVLTVIFFFLLYLIADVRSLRLRLLLLIGWIGACAILIEVIFELKDGNGRGVFLMVILALIGIGYGGYQVFDVKSMFPPRIPQGMTREEYNILMAAVEESKHPTPAATPKPVDPEVEQYRRDVTDALFTRLGGRYSIVYDLPESSGQFGGTEYMVIQRLDGSALIYFDIARQKELGLSVAQVAEAAERSIQGASPEALAAMNGFAPEIKPQTAGNFDFGMELLNAAPSVQTFYANFGHFDSPVPSTATLVLRRATRDIRPVGKRAWELILAPEDLAPLQSLGLAEAGNVNYRDDEEIPIIDGVPTQQGFNEDAGDASDSDAEREYKTPLGNVKAELWVFQTTHAALSDYFGDKFRLPAVSPTGYMALIPEPVCLPDRYLALKSEQQNGQTLTWFVLERWVETVGFRLTLPNQPTPAQRIQLMKLADVQEAKIRRLLNLGA